jgi:hypothetical protein
LGRPGWHYWLLFLPFYNLYLAGLMFFKKGAGSPNAFGPDPLQPSTPAPSLSVGGSLRPVGLRRRAAPNMNLDPAVIERQNLAWPGA